LLILWQITRKGRYAIWFQPNTSVCDFYMREDVCGRKLFLQTLCGLILIWGKSSDVDERGNAGVYSGGSDDGTAIGVTNQDCGLRHSPESPFNGSDISSMGVQTVLGCDYLEAFFLQRRDQLGEA